MAVYVNTNVSSLNGQRYLNNVQTSLNTTYQRLSRAIASTRLRMTPQASRSPIA